MLAVLTLKDSEASLEARVGFEPTTHRLTVYRSDHWTTEPIKTTLHYYYIKIFDIFQMKGCFDWQTGFEKPI